MDCQLSVEKVKDQVHRISKTSNNCRTSGAGGSGADYKLSITIVRPNFKNKKAFVSKPQSLNLIAYVAQTNIHLYVYLSVSLHIHYISTHILSLCINTRNSSLNLSKSYIYDDNLLRFFIR